MSETSILVLTVIGPVLRGSFLGVKSAGQRHWRFLQLLQQHTELFLYFGRGLTLVSGDEVSDIGLNLQGLQVLLYGLIIHVGEEECSFDLTLLHVGGKRGRIRNSGITHTMF